MKAETTKVKGKHRRVPLAAREVQIIRRLKTVIKMGKEQALKLTWTDS